MKKTKSNTQEPITEVVFRKFKDDKSIIALFPYEIENGYGIGSYMHVGQHSSADYHQVISISTPATPQEYADLKRELEQPPYNYNLKVIAKYSHLKYLIAYRKSIAV